jgi:hypothetical protein
MPSSDLPTDAAAPQTARNAPCPCGSGLRYKHCHGKEPPLSAPPPRDPRARLAREIPLLGATEEEMQALFTESDGKRAETRAALAKLQGYLLFIGYPRSGHSLVGALLDAHPDMLVAHELDVLRFQSAGFDREQIAYLLMRNSALTAAAGRGWGGYDYSVPGQWQGRVRTLRLLGDKKGGRTSELLARDPELLDELESLFEGRARFIHVLRNPFDCIATMAQKKPCSVSEAGETFFKLCEVNQGLRARIGSERAIDIRHEDMVLAPRETLRRLCRFLEVEAEDDYLEGCAAIVSPTPRASRHKVAWRRDEIAAVERQIEGFDFLAGYGFTDATRQG